MPSMNSPQPGWKPPRWLFSVIAILIVAWWVANQPPPRGERPAAPSADQNAHFEPPIEVVPRTIAEPSGESALTESDTAAKDLPEIAPRSETPSVSRTPPASKPKPAAASAANDPLIIPNVTVKDQSGRVAFKGNVDLHLTFDRIERGDKFPHRNDGSTFRNLEKRLPKQPVGYYTEYVHPTPGMSGPGPQRVIIGKGGEAFYTHDHYNSFRKVRG